ncbi:MAG TPA: hypothetical protein VIL20_16115 [Sandaracinaceae bacterium]
MAATGAMPPNEPLKLPNGLQTYAVVLGIGHGAAHACVRDSPLPAGDTVARASGRTKKGGHPRRG